MVWVFAVALALLTALFVGKYFELKRGEQFFAATSRACLDRRILSGIRKLRDFFSHSKGRLKHHSRRTTVKGKSAISRLLRRLAEKME